MLLGSAHPAKNHSVQSVPAHSPKDSFLTAQCLGRQFRDVTETGYCPLGQLYNSFSGLVPMGIFMMVPLSTVSLGSIGHPYSTVIARGLSQDVSLLHLLHYRLDLTLHPS